jgi:short-subunit dehydrogenase
MTTLITGASKGIGKDLAYEFAAHGHDLVLIARSKDLLEKIKEDIENRFKVQVDIYDFDLTKHEAREKFLFNFKGDIEILINNAGFGDFAAFAEADLEKNLSMVDLNIKALMHFSHHFAQKFIEENDSKKNYKILNVASIAAFSPGPYMATYFATKAFVLSFSNALHEELKVHDIHVASLCPGATHSEFGNVAGIKNAIAFKAAMPGEEVARIAYQDLMKNKRVIVTGIQNKLVVSMMKMSPSSTNAKISGKIMAQSQ